MHPDILPRRGGTARAGFVGGVLNQHIYLAFHRGGEFVVVSILNLSF